MLNFTVKPGECFTIGDEIKVVVLGGTANNIKVMVEAPRSYNIVRGKVLERTAEQREELPNQKTYYAEPAIPAKKMQRMIAAQKKAGKKQEDRKSRAGNNAVLT